jgi:hypothetical protein
MLNEESSSRTLERSSEKLINASEDVKVGWAVPGL